MRCSVFEDHIETDVTDKTRTEGERFDSLQDLLARAGYKDTRVITPQAKVLAEAANSVGSSLRSISTVSKANHQPKSGSRGIAEGPYQKPTRTKSRSPTRHLASSRGNFGESVGSSKAESSHNVPRWLGKCWWGNLSSWKPYPKGEALNQDEWSGEASRTHFPSADGEAAESELPKRSWPQSLAGSLYDSPRSPGGTRVLIVSSPSRRKQVNSGRLAKKASAPIQGLWKGSLAYRQSHLDLKMRSEQVEQVGPVKTFKKKGSLGHLRGGVGVGISAIDSNPKFPAFRVGPASSQANLASFNGHTTGQTQRSEDLSEPAARRHATVDQLRLSLRETKASFDSGYRDDDVSDDYLESARDGFVNKRFPKVPATYTADLFASVAKPLVISESAVAPRNANCFQGPDSRGLRHAKSVEALRGALAASRNARPALKGSHSVIGQQSTKHSPEDVPPVPPLLFMPSMQSAPSDPDLAGQLGLEVRTTYQANEMKSGEVVDEVASDLKSPERSVEPPVLTLTSPTGVHSPKFINLTGKEFEPQTFSPLIAGRVLTNESGRSHIHPNSDQAATFRGRACRRSVSQRSVRVPSVDESQPGGSDAAESISSSASSSQLLGKPKRTRRGCRAGRKHRPGGSNLQRPQSPSDGTGSTQCRNHIEAVVAGSTVEMFKRTVSARVNQCEAALSARTSTASMTSFAAAMRGPPEDDPFVAHDTTKEEAKKGLSKDGQRLRSRGIASILASRDENIEEDSENSGFGGDLFSYAQGSRVRHQGSSGTLRGRIVGRTAPMDQTAPSLRQSVGEKKQQQQ